MRHPALSIGLALLPPLVAAEASAQAPEASAESSRWVDDLRLDVFVDAFAAINSQGNAYALTDGAAGHRDYVYNEGFQLSFAGLDARYERGKIGATASLRFGPSVVRYFGDNGGLGFANLTQAYLTWKPADAISIDLGQFSTLYGAEVAESWLNANYTRGALYYAMQPFWHVGVRASYQASDALRLSAMVVNGVNNPVDLDETPGIGAQAAFSGEGFGVILGYMWTANDTSKDAFDFFEHLVDLIVTAEAGDFGLVFNADYGIAGDTSFYGASLTPRLTLSENIGVALRGEYLAYPDNTGADFVPGAGGVYEGLVTVTGTLDWRPVGNSHFVLRPEARYEMALGADAFADADGKATAGWWTLVLGAVVNSF